EAEGAVGGELRRDDRVGVRRERHRGGAPRADQHPGPDGYHRPNLPGVRARHPRLAARAHHRRFRRELGPSGQVSRPRDRLVAARPHVGSPRRPAHTARHGGRERSRARPADRDAEPVRGLAIARGLHARGRRAGRPRPRGRAPLGAAPRVALRAPGGGGQHLLHDELGAPHDRADLGTRATEPVRRRRDAVLERLRGTPASANRVTGTRLAAPPSGCVVAATSCTARRPVDPEDLGRLLHLRRSPTTLGEPNGPLPVHAPPPVVPQASRTAPAEPQTAPTTLGRLTARGKFLYVGDEKFYIRGVTYGTFQPRADGSEVPEPDVVEQDFALMAAHGINAVRTYTVPPRWLLDAAARHGLRVMIGL